MAILIMVGQLILSLSILIVLHELGHFIPARLFNTRVEKFYLFFDPGFSLFKKKIGETEYGIGWLPLGGYVKIAGMVDESFDKEQMQGEPQPWEFRSKPAWQRLIIMLGGVTVNFILGFLLYGMVLWHWGEEFLPSQNAEYGIHVDSLGMELGLQNGDHILKLGDKAFKEFNDKALIREISINNASTITVKRNGEVIDLPIDESWSSKLVSHENKNKTIFYPRIPFVVGKVSKGMPAEAAGIQQDDQIIALNDTPTPFFDQFTSRSKNHKKEDIKVTVLRQQDTLALHIATTEDGKIGVVPYGPTHFFETERIKYEASQIIPAGYKKGMDFLGVQLKAFGQMFRGKIKVTDSLGGFASIGKMFGSEWNWERFWTMTAILSLILAFMNLLPIPALDGGHVVFLLFEVVTGVKPSDRVMEVANIIGFVIVIGLLIFANGLDIFREWFSK